MKPPAYDSRIYTACADVLILAAQLRSATQLPPASELRQRLQTALSSMVVNGRALGVADADLAEARYALVAFIDGQLAEYKWPGHAAWQSLELELYKETLAGEKFFQRMRGLMDAQRLTPLVIYYLCLACGFRGAASAAATLPQLTDQARQLLARVLPPPNKLSLGKPHERRAARVVQDHKPLVGLIGGCSLLVLVVLVGLGWSVSSRLQQTVSSWQPISLHDAARGQ